MAEDDRERQADALSKMTGGGGGKEPEPAPPPASAAMFRKARPPAPGLEPSEPEPDPRRAARPDRPVAPPASETPAPGYSPAQRLGAVTTAESDTVPIYVPPPAPGAPARSSINPAALLATRTLGRKRTVIPILLTCGALLVISGAARWVVSDDSAFHFVSAAMSLALLGFGGLLLFIAVLNMLQVRDQIAAGASKSRQAQAP